MYPCWNPVVSFFFHGLFFVSFLICCYYFYLYNSLYIFQSNFIDFYKNFVRAHTHTLIFSTRVPHAGCGTVCRQQTRGPKYVRKGIWARGDFGLLGARMIGWTGCGSFFSATGAYQSLRRSRFSGTTLSNRKWVIKLWTTRTEKGKPLDFMILDILKNDGRWEIAKQRLNIRNIDRLLCPG